MAYKRDLLALAIASLLLVILASLFTTFLVINRTINVSKEGSVTDSKYPVRISQAYPVCDNKLAEKYGDRLVSKTYDNISSRYDRRRRVHMLFAYIDIEERGTGSVEEWYAVCQVSAKNNRLKEFDVVKASRIK